MPLGSAKVLMLVYAKACSGISVNALPEAKLSEVMPLLWKAARPSVLSDAGSVTRASCSVPSKADASMTVSLLPVAKVSVSIGV